MEVSDIIREYGKKRVDIVRKYYKTPLDIELCLDAWKEYSVNPAFFNDKTFFHEFFNYENVVAKLGNYFSFG